MTEKTNQGILYQDKRGNSASLMRPLRGHTYDFAYTATKGVTAEITEQVVRLYATTACYVKIGEISDLSVSSSDYDLYLPATTPIDIKLFETDKYISAVQVSTGGTMYINGWK
jgi:hypothetical protein